MILGILADTHVPDRRPELDARVLSIFEEAGVQQVLHAGDVSTPRVLDELAAIGHVYAVRGNRDWLRLRHLRPQLTLDIEGQRVILTHGHGGFWRYWLEKVHMVARGYRLEFYSRYLLKRFPTADVIIFGHSHMPEAEWYGDTLLLNPGSPCCPHAQDPPTVAILDVTGGRVEGRLVAIEGEVKG